MKKDCDIAYLKFRKYLKSCDKPKLVCLCCKVGVVGDDRALILMSYHENHELAFIADHFHSSEGKILRWKMNVMSRIRSWCRANTGGTCSEETLAILDQLLSPRKKCILCNPKCPYYGGTCEPMSSQDE